MTRNIDENPGKEKPNKLQEKKANYNRKETENVFL